jgi:hypothetical protein
MPVLRVLFTATVLISKVVHSSYHPYVDADLAKRAFSTAVAMFKRCCVEDNDLHGRTTKVLAQLWSIHSRLSEENQQPPSLALKSRLFFSITHDALWQWRREYAGKPNSGAPSLPPPLLSPSVTTISAGSPSSARQYPVQVETAGHLNTEVHGAHEAGDLGDIPGISMEHHFLLPIQANDGPSPSERRASSQDQLSRNENPCSPGGIDLDVLFPETIMGYSDQNWLSMMR